MKNSVYALLLVLITWIVSTLQARIEFPLTLDRTTGNKEFAIEYHKPISPITDNLVSHAIIKATCKVNGYPFQVPFTLQGEIVKPVKGEVQFFPAVTIEQLNHHLAQSRLTRMEEKEGYYTAYYTIKDTQESVSGKEREIILSTQRAGRLYQCPLPHQIVVSGHTKTPYLRVQSVPACHGLSAQECQKKRQETYVHKNNCHSFNKDGTQVTIAPLGEQSVATSYRHSATDNITRAIPVSLIKYSTHGKVVGDAAPQVIIDSSHKITSKPLVWNVMKDEKGKSQLFTYTHQAPCADKILHSVPLELEKDKAFIAIPESHHMGFAQPEKQALKNSGGTVGIPSLYATKFTKDEDDMIAITCMYGDPHAQEDHLVLTASLDVPVERCYLYGKDAVTQKEYKGIALKSKYTINKDITIVSKSHTPNANVQEHPVLHVVPSTLAR